MRSLGNGLHSAKDTQAALSVKEAELSMQRRLVHRRRHTRRRPILPVAMMSLGGVKIAYASYRTYTHDVWSSLAKQTYTPSQQPLTTPLMLNDLERPQKPNNCPAK